MRTVEKWDVFEVEVKGKSEGNPFADYTISGTFAERNDNGRRLLRWGRCVPGTLYAIL